MAPAPQSAATQALAAALAAEGGSNATASRLNSHGTLLQPGEDRFDVDMRAKAGEPQLQLQVRLLASSSSSSITGQLASIGVLHTCRPVSDHLFFPPGNTVLSSQFNTVFIVVTCVMIYDRSLLRCLEIRVRCSCAYREPRHAALLLRWYHS